MPAYRCKHPTCTNYLAAKNSYCHEHKDKDTTRKESNRVYDRFHRNRDTKSFYASNAWEIARKIHISRYCVCQKCNDQFGTMVHHIIPISEPAGWTRRLDQKNLLTVCDQCHADLHIELDGG